MVDNVAEPGPRRISIRKPTQEIVREGFKLPDLDSDFLRVEDPSPEEAVQIWLKIGKHERYALTAILLDRAVDRALTDRDSQDGFSLTPSNAAQNMNEVNSHISDRLKKALTEEMHYLDTLSDDENTIPLKRTWERIKEWGTFRYRHQLQGHIKLADVSIPTSISDPLSGVGTMNAIFSAIPAKYVPVHHKYPPDDEFMRIIRNSLPAIQRMAGNDLGTFNFIVARSGGVDNLSRMFNLVEDDRPRLTIDDTQVEEVRAQMVASGVELPPRIGCPVLVRIDSDASMKKIVDWHLDLFSQHRPHTAPVILESLIKA